MSQADQSSAVPAPDFAGIVQAALGAFLQARGFEAAETSPQVVTFASPGAVLMLAHDSFTHEIETSLALAVDRSTHVSLAAVVAATGSRQAEIVEFHAGTAVDIARCLEAIRDLLESHAEGILQGNRAEFESARATVNRDLAMTREFFPNQPLHAAAESAWRRRDFAEVKRLYESMTHQLTATEARRLEFARRHVP